MRARYVVAADGAKSPMRERLGIAHAWATARSPTASRSTSAPTSTRCIGDRNLSVIYVFHPRLTGFFRFSLAGDAGFLVVNSTVDEDGRPQHEPGEDMSEERCIEYVRGRSAIPTSGRDRERAALELDGRLGGAAAGGARLPRRRRGPRDAPDRRLRRQLRRPRCRQPGLEARGRAARRGGPRAARDLRRRATARSRSSRSSRPTPATSCGSIPRSARRT